MPKKRVLVHGLSNNMAGTEAVIQNVSLMLADCICFDYLVYEPLANHLELLQSGENRQIVSPGKGKNPIAYQLFFNSFFKEHGQEYAAVWVNRNNLRNTDLLGFAKKHGIKKRIIHMHSIPVLRSRADQALESVNRRRLRRLATDYWACSDEAGQKWYPGIDYHVIPNAIDCSRFAFNEELRSNIRSVYGIGDELVIGHVGRISREKNQTFLLHMMKQLLSQEPNAKLMLVGDGSMRDEVQTLCGELGIADSVIFTGPQNDMQAYYSAFDVFVLPSLWEGLPVTLVEAQFNGLPCIISTNVSRESSFSNLTTYLPIEDANLEQWANTIMTSRRIEPEYTAAAKRYDIQHIKDFVLEAFDND